jgi:hypothetical protein
LTYKATKLTTKVALKTTKVTAKTTYKVATDSRTHAALKATGKVTANVTVGVAKGTSKAASAAAPVIGSGIKSGIAAAPAAMSASVSAAKMGGKGVVQSAGFAKKGVVALNQLRIEQVEELDEEAQKAVLEQARKDARRQAAVDLELRKLRVLRNDGVISEDDFVRQEAYITTSSIPIFEEVEEDDENDAEAQLAVVVSSTAVKLFSPIKYGKGEFAVRRTELEDWLYELFTKGRAKKRKEKALMWANVIMNAGISSLGHLQELVD